MMQFKLPDRPGVSDKLAFFGRKVKIIMGVVKLAATGPVNEPAPRVGHLYYFTKQNFFAVKGDDNLYGWDHIVQLATIKTFEFDDRKAMFKVTLMNTQVFKFVFKIKEVSALFQKKIKKHLEFLRLNRDEQRIRKPGQIKFFVGAFFDNVVLDFHNQLYTPKPAYKSLIEGCWSRSLFDPKTLPLFFKESPLKELESFFAKSDSVFEPHCFIANCQIRLAGDSELSGGSQTGTGDPNEPKSLLLLTMSKPMFSVLPRGKAISSLFNKYLQPGKLFSNFTINRVYVISRIQEHIAAPVSYWQLPLQCSKQ